MPQAEEIPIVIEVSGGIVQAVYTKSGAPITVVVVDHDNDESSDHKCERIVKRMTQDLIEVGFETHPE